MRDEEHNRLLENIERLRRDDFPTYARLSNRLAVENTNKAVALLICIFWAIGIAYFAFVEQVPVSNWVLYPLWLFGMFVVCIAFGMSGSLAAAGLNNVIYGTPFGSVATFWMTGLVAWVATFITAKHVLLWLSVWFPG